MAKDSDKPGRTGRFPEGKIHSSDEGEVQFRCGIRDGNVVLDFGTPVAWIGMAPDQAVRIATALIERAQEAAREKGIPLTIRI